mmetsp:Transcript_16419/g.35673  ORF Transcript_16419/g.35673 Transcript_16419/m.35673 type:complete len:215 (-) Transcript_16419:364-1008(-)
MPRARRTPCAHTPSIGHVASPLDVAASIYDIATSIVFFVAHVSAELRVGIKILLRVTVPTNPTTNLTIKDIGEAMSRGNGYPEENIKTSICILRLTHFPMGGNLALAGLSSRKVPNLDISRPHSLSAKNKMVQSESRTRSALRPWQHNANASLAGSDDTISNRYGCELKPDGALRAMLRQCNACRTTVRSDTDAVALGFCFVLSLVPCAVVSFI